MNLIADLRAVEERIKQAQDRIFRQQAMIRHLRETHALPCLIDTAQRLRGAMISNLFAIFAHRNCIAAALEKYSKAGVLSAMQLGLTEPHCELGDLPYLTLEPHD